MATKKSKKKVINETAKPEEKKESYVVYIWEGKEYKLPTYNNINIIPQADGVVLIHFMDGVPVGSSVLLNETLKVMANALKPTAPIQKAQVK